MSSCWINRSPISIIMYVIIIFLLPLIILLIVIVHFRLNVYQYQYGCEDYCNSKEERYAPPDDDIQHKNKDYSPIKVNSALPRAKATKGTNTSGRVRKRSIQPSPICSENFVVTTDYPYIVAMVKINKEKTGKIVMRYLGAGALIAPNVVLTSTEIFLRENISNPNIRRINLKTTYVRIGSNFWVTGGVIHEIQDFRYQSSQVLAIQLKHNVLDVIKPIRYNADPNTGAKAIVYGYGWSKQNRFLPVSKIKIYTGPCLNDSINLICGIVDNIRDCKSIVGVPLLDNLALIGLHRSGKCSQKTLHYFDKIKYNKVWLHKGRKGIKPILAS